MALGHEIWLQEPHLAEDRSTFGVAASGQNNMIKILPKNRGEQSCDRDLGCLHDDGHRVLCQNLQQHLYAVFGGHQRTQGHVEQRRHISPRPTGDGAMMNIDRPKFARDEGIDLITADCAFQGTAPRIVQLPVGRAISVPYASAKQKNQVRFPCRCEHPEHNWRDSWCALKVTDTGRCATASDGPTMVLPSSSPCPRCQASFGTWSQSVFNTGQKGMFQHSSGPCHFEWRNLRQEHHEWASFRKSLSAHLCCTNGTRPIMSLPQEETGIASSTTSGRAHGTQSAWLTRE